MFGMENPFQTQQASQTASATPNNNSQTPNASPDNSVEQETGTPEAVPEEPAITMQQKIASMSIASEELMDHVIKVNRDGEFLHESFANWTEEHREELKQKFIEQFERDNPDFKSKQEAKHYIGQEMGALMDKGYKEYMAERKRERANDTEGKIGKYLGYGAAGLGVAAMMTNPVGWVGLAALAAGGGAAYFGYKGLKDDEGKWYEDVTNWDIATDVVANAASGLPFAGKATGVAVNAAKGAATATKAGTLAFSGKVADAVAKIPVAYKATAAGVSTTSALAYLDSLPSEDVDRNQITSQEVPNNKQRQNLQRS